MKIQDLRADHYRIPLPSVLSDSTHGLIEGFELVTARVRDADSAEGVGYTYTVGTGGAAVHALIARDLAPRLAGRQAEDIEALWQAMWWALHYGGRGGAQALAISAVDIALWDLRARRQGAPLWRVLGGFDPRVPCYAGGIDLELPLDALLRQTDDNLARGFRAIKMKVGRPSLREDVERARAMRAHLGREVALMADANMRWSVDEAIRAARALRDLDLVWLEEPTIPDDVPGHVRIVREGGVPIAAAMCNGPVSPETTTAASRSSTARSATVVAGASFAAPPEDATTDSASSRSDGPQVINDRSRVRRNSAAATAPNRSAGHRLFGHAAPGFNTMNLPGPPAAPIAATTSGAAVACSLIVIGLSGTFNALNTARFLSMTWPDRGGITVSEYKRTACGSLRHSRLKPITRVAPDSRAHTADLISPCRSSAAS